MSRIREASVVVGLKIIPAIRRDYHTIQHMPDLDYSVIASDESVLTQVGVEHAKLRDFHRVDRGRREDLYIGWSSEVQHYLNMPFDILCDENDQIRASERKGLRVIEKLKTANLLKRIKWVFTGVTL